MNPNAAPDDTILIDSEIESWQRDQDAKLLMDATKPGVEILTQFGPLGIQVSERGDSGERVLTWSSNGLNFARRMYATDPAAGLSSSSTGIRG